MNVNRGIFLKNLLVIFFLVIMSALAVAFATQVIIFDQTSMCPADAQNCTFEIFQNGARTSSITLNNGTSLEAKLTANYLPPINNSNSTNSTVPNNSTNSTIPDNSTNKIVILQMDDCQVWWLTQTCINIVKMHIQKQADITVGFIPETITDDAAWKAPLLDWNTNYKGRVEIAEHTFDHSSDYSGWTVSKIVADLNKGKAQFALYNITPTTFIPAFDWSANSAAGASAAGFLVALDGSKNTYASGWINQTLVMDDGVYCGDDYSSCANMDYAKLKLLIDAAIQKKGYGIVLFHQQDFSTVGSRQYKTLYAKWNSTLDKLKADYNLMTAAEYRDLALKK
jgi:hypothetical protein